VHTIPRSDGNFRIIINGNKVIEDWTGLALRIKETGPATSPFLAADFDSRTSSPGRRAQKILFYHYRKAPNQAAPSIKEIYAFTYIGLVLQQHLSLNQPVAMRLYMIVVSFHDDASC